MKEESRKYARGHLYTPAEFLAMMPPQEERPEDRPAETEMVAMAHLEHRLREEREAYDMVCAAINRWRTLCHARNLTIPLMGRMQAAFRSDDKGSAADQAIEQAEEEIEAAKENYMAATMQRQAAWQALSQASEERRALRKREWQEERARLTAARAEELSKERKTRMATALQRLRERFVA